VSGFGSARRHTDYSAARFVAVAVCLALFFGLGASLSAQAPDAAAAAQEPTQSPFSQSRIMLFPLVQMGVAPDLSETGRNLVDILSGSLGTEFEDAGFDVIIGQEIPGVDATTPPGGAVAPAIEAARERDADFVAIGFTGFPDGRVAVNTRVYDVDSRGLVAAASGFGRSDLAVFNITRRLFRDMRPGLESAVARRRGTGVVDVAGDRPIADPLVLSSPDEGMQVFLGSNVRVGRVTDGTVRLPYLPFEPGETVSVRKRKPGYYEETEEVLVREGGSEVALDPLKPETRFATTVTYTTGQLLGLGVGVRGYIRPDWSFIAAESYGYVQTTNPGATPVAYHQDFRLIAGRYFVFPRTALFRFGAHTGAGRAYTFFSSADADTFRDTYIELFGLWIELNLPDVAFFASSAARWSLGTSQGLLERGSLDSGGVGPFLSLGTLVKWQK
jgi:TolB-like protein